MLRDAEATAEAVQRPRMRFVPTRSVERLDLQAMHRLRSRLVRVIADLSGDLRHLDERLDEVTAEIQDLPKRTMPASA